MDGEPTEELDAITGEIPLAPELLEDLPMESERENNGPPVVWLAAAVVLLVGAIATIVLIGQNRDDGDSASTSVTSAASSGSVTEATPPIGDPSAGAAGGNTAVTTSDTSPPDEAAPEPSSPDPTTGSDPSTTSESADVPAASGLLVIGEPVVTTVADDFEIAVATDVCTTIEWSFTGEGQSASYTSEQLCFNEHILSPRPEHPLQPGTDYEVTATFSAEGVSEVIVVEITTAG